MQNLKKKNIIYYLFILVKHSQDKEAIRCYISLSKNPTEIEKSIVLGTILGVKSMIISGVILDSQPLNHEWDHSYHGNTLLLTLQDPSQFCLVKGRSPYKV